MTLLRTLSGLLASARRNVVWLLIAVYGLAAFLPATGDELRGLTLGQLPFSAGVFNPTHLLLAVLLFCVGVAVCPHDARNVRQRTLLVGGGVLGSWIIPMIALGALLLPGSVWTPGPVIAAFLAGAILVVAMPPANSAAVWSELSGDRTATTLWIIILGTLVSPLATPLVVGLFAQVISRPELEAAQSAASLLEVLFAFVVLPAALGGAARMLLDALRPRWIEPVQEAGRWTSLTALLLLNYINAAAVLPSLVASGITIEAGYVALLTLLLCLAVFVGGGVIGHWLGTRGPGERLSFVYCVGMKNTGAALVLATTLLADQPLAMLVPLMYTLAQHFAAALLDRVVAHPARVRARVEEASNEVGPMLASRG